MDLWRRICHGDEEAEQREVITHFELLDAAEAAQGLKASYVRTREWKLLVNASLSFVEIPSNRYWVDYDASFKLRPPRDAYEAMVQNETLRGRFASRCYDELLAAEEEEDEAAELEFAYAEVLLFRIGEDQVEACDVAAQFVPEFRRLSEAVRRRQ